MKKIFTTLTLILCALLTYAQIATKSTPPSFNKNLTAKVETHQLPAFDVAKMLAEDKAEKGLRPFRFGKKHKVNITPKDAGTWDKLPNGDRIWRMTFTSKGAYSLNFLFSRFYMPNNAKLYAYNADRTDVRGAFTALNNKSDGMFAISPIDGETVTLEDVEPAEVRGQSIIEISHVVHAYRSLGTVAEEVLEKGYGDSGSCNIDVACPESAGWEDQIRSVVFIIENGAEACSGAMINNTAQDGTPYMLTADHCGLNMNSNWTFIFNYQSPSCNGPDTNRDQSIAGGQLRASYGPSDFALFELSMPPPPDYVAYYAGWNKLDNPAQNATCIHHPAGDVKKISFNDDPLYDSAGNATEVPGGSFWAVGQWEVGTTEGGSSGSPIFDQNKLIVGQLNGGFAACGNQQYDVYGKFSVSWTGGGTPASRLSDWLGEGVDTLHGAYFIEPPLAINMQVMELAGIGQFTCAGGPIAPELTVRNIGSTDINELSIEYSYDGGNTTQTYDWTGSNIGFYQTATIALPEATLGEATYNFTANIVAANGMSDDDIADNTVTYDFEVIQGNNLKVNLLTDNFPDETTYEIIDQSTGNVVYTGNNFQNSQLDIADLCLPEGCYTFSIYDTAADGICCVTFGNGNYELIDGTGNTLAEGGQFMVEDRVDFCLPYTFLSEFNAPEQVCPGQTFQAKNFSQLANSFTWSAPGATPSTSTAIDPTFTYSQLGTYTITLTASDGMNSKTHAQQIQVIEDNEITFNLFTDNYPLETSFQITERSSGTVLYERDSFTTAQAQLYVEKFCLGGGCYNFTIFDSQRDGICCGFGNGNYQLLDARGNELGMGGQFRSADNVQFCIDTVVDVDDVQENDAVRIFPNPTNGLVHIQADGIAQRVEVYDVTGRQIYANYQNNTLNMSQQMAGIYFIEIIFDGGSVTKRLIVE